MALTIMTNELAMAAQRNLGQTQNRLHSTLQKLASGSRIIQASDDPAGLAISDQMNAQARSLGQGIRNAQDGISFIQIFEGGTNEINNMLMRIRELAMSSSSDTVGENERAMLNNEVEQLIGEVNRIAHSTKYGDTQLLNGASVRLEFQVGTGNDDAVDRILFSPGDSNMTIDGLGLSGIHVADRETARATLTRLDSALTRVNETRARVGAAQNRMHSTIAAQSIYQENILVAKSRIRDADIAQESANLVRETILSKAGIAVLTQANEVPALALQLLNR